MNKEKQRRSLTWKYFWKRKRQEVGDAKWGILFFQMVIFFILGFSFSLVAAEKGITHSPIGLLLMTIVLVEMIILIFGVIIYYIIKWIKSNWISATKDAVKELNRRSRKNE